MINKLYKLTQALNSGIDVGTIVKCTGICDASYVMCLVIMGGQRDGSKPPQIEMKISKSYLTEVTRPEMAQVCSELILEKNVELESLKKELLLLESKRQWYTDYTTDGEALSAVLMKQLASCVTDGEKQDVLTAFFKDRVNFDAWYKE